MKLNKLILNDFGVYQGNVVFDLGSGEKPIVIFGGKNGSGKTTLLEAIKLCFYGKRALGYRTDKKEYEDHIKNRIHRTRGAVVPLNHTSISVSFDYSIYGNDQHFEIIRSWKIKPEKFQEQLKIKLNGNLLTNPSEERWQDYIDDLIPPSITELFFFDGEKIQDLIIDNFNEQAFGVEVKRLLGLNIVEKLQADLDTYLYRQRKENAITEFQLKLDQEEKIFWSIDKKYQNKILEVSHLQSKIENIEGQIEKLERQVNLESSGYAFQRDNLKTLLARTDLELEVVEKQLHELSASLLPFALIPELCDDLKKQLILEGDIQKWQSSNSLIAPKISDIRQTLYSSQFWESANGSLSSSIRDKISDQISSMLDELLLSESNIPEIKILHKVSDYDRYKIISWIDESKGSIPSKVIETRQNLINLERTRQDILVKLNNVPDEDVLRPLFENLNELNKELGGIQSILNRANLEKNTLYNEREESERQIKKAFDNLKFGRRIENRIEMILKTKSALIEFLVEVTKRKMVRLELLIATKFSELSRKSDLIKKITIDPQSFNIQLFDFDDLPVPKDLLSAGEKQMFAIALLWALRELSGKLFPVLIDTPLGRLDSDHRHHLVDKYFSKVSHQVILFSTDTEIDELYFKALEPDISHTYYLDYDSKRGKTIAIPGYFWKEGQYAAK